MKPFFVVAVRSAPLSNNTEATYTNKLKIYVATKFCLKNTHNVIVYSYNVCNEYLETKYFAYKLNNNTLINFTFSEDMYCSYYRLAINFINK